MSTRVDTALLGPKMGTKLVPSKPPMQENRHDQVPTLRLGEGAGGSGIERGAALPDFCEWWHRMSRDEAARGSRGVGGDRSHRHGCRDRQDSGSRDGKATLAGW